MNTAVIDGNKFLETVESAEPIRRTGRVMEIIGLIIESKGPGVSVGDACTIECLGGNGRVQAEVVGFRGERVLLMPLGVIGGIAPGASVAASGRPLRVPVGHELLGRVLDGLGNPIDGLGPTGAKKTRPLVAAPPNPLTRRRISTPLATGIRSIDGLLTCGKGQRVGIFSGSGVGKSVLLGMIARNCEADLNVIALIGERGREVRDFIEKDLGPEGLRKSVVVAVTSDQAAMIRLKGALLATTIAEHFRDLGLDVMLMMDSLTRVAMSQREIGSPSASRRRRRATRRRSSRFCPAFSSGRARRRSAASPASTRCSWKGMTCPSRSRTRPARSWTATSSSPASSPRRTTIRRWTCSRA